MGLITLRSYSMLIVRVVVLLVGVALLPYSGLLERIDAVFYDKISVFHNDTPDDRIVIVAIDETSLQVLGRWPWSRRVHAEFINRLASSGQNVVAFDLLFSEPEDSDPIADSLLGTAMAMHGHVVLPVAPAMNSHLNTLYLNEPIPQLRNNTMLGHVDVELDHDGIARRVFLMAGIDASVWPALGFALVQQKANLGKSYRMDQVAAETAGTSGQWVRSHEVLIPYVGPPGTYRKISYAQILYDDSILNELDGKMVIVGMTAAGMGTRFATPVSPINRQPISGVEWQANVVDMLQNNRAVHPVSTLSYSLISVAWVLVLLLSISLLRIDFTVPLLLVFLSCGLLINGLILVLMHTWIPPSAGFLGVLAIYSLWNWHRINDFMRSLFLAKVHLDATLESVGDGVITTDMHDRVTYLNNGAEKITGANLAQTKGKLLHQVLNLRMTQNDDFDEVSESKLPVPEFGARTIQCYLKTANGNHCTVRVTRHKFSDEKERLLGFVIAIADITNTVELTQQVAHQASHDALTRLPNRALLLTRFGQMVTAIQKTDEASVVTVFFVTLDNFKKINNALGHRAGDELLVIVAQRLREVAYKENIVARWGGDEFVLLFDDLHKEDAVPEIAQNILNAVGKKFHLDGQEVYVTASIGISSYPEDGVHGDEVLERAGTAMYRVKHEGGNNFSVYSQESSIVWTRDRLELEKELHAALANDDLQVLYQPIIDTHQRRIVRMEALVRWPHPVHGLLSPADFIPLAEHTGLINQLGEMVLRAACNVAQDLLQKNRPISVAVNVAPVQLLQSDFVQIVSQILQDTALPAQFLILEITENAIVSNMAHAAATLAKIKLLGVSIALDDFGTGYSSLSLLRELPIDILKIDKSFTRMLDQSAQDLTIIQAVTGLGANLSMAVIAEGVESAQQMQILLEQKCYLHQGYHFSPAVSYESLLALMGESNRLSPALADRIFDINDF